MINVRKGTAHSLQQADVLGTTVLSEGVVAGMVCRVNSSGQIKKGVDTSATNKTSLLGFAINNQADGDVIECGKIGLYTLDGNSVIETDQTASTAITAANFPIGANLTADTGGQVLVTTTAGDIIVGKVYGVRALPSTATVQGSDGRTTVIQTTANVLAIKLASANNQVGS